MEHRYEFDEMDRIEEAVKTTEEGMKCVYEDVNDGGDSIDF